jgi:mannose-6-phosphate isomerase
VIRAGLTPKHIDIPELVRVLDPEVAVPILAARQVGGGVEEGGGVGESGCVEEFDTPVPEFRLRRLTVQAGQSEQPEQSDRSAESASARLRVPGDGLPRILLCVEGSATVTNGDDTLELARGRSCYLSAADAAVMLTGDARLFLASPGN